MKIVKNNLLVFMGGQGSGKGTFARLLLKIKHFDYIEVGQILRDMSDNPEINNTISKGDFISNDIVYNLLKEKIIDKDVILDGFPRTLEQAKWLVNAYTDKYNIYIIYLNISKEEMFERVANRLKEGGDRNDDKDFIAVEKRIARFFNLTMPAINWLRNQNNIFFYNIDAGRKSIEENLITVKSVLNI